MTATPVRVVCPRCNGSGEIVSPDSGVKIGFAGVFGCSMCRDGKGYITGNAAPGEKSRLFRAWLREALAELEDGREWVTFRSYSDEEIPDDGAMVNDILATLCPEEAPCPTD